MTVAFFFFPELLQTLNWSFFTVLLLDVMIYISLVFTFFVFLFIRSSLIGYFFYSSHISVIPTTVNYLVMHGYSLLLTDVGTVVPS